MGNIDVCVYIYIYGFRNNNAPRSTITEVTLGPPVGRQTFRDWLLIIGRYRSYDDGCRHRSARDTVLKYRAGNGQRWGDTRADMVRF